MEKTYNPHQIEQVLYEEWERAGHFRPSGRGEPFCIMIPPPNVTGSLHMGHAFQDTLMDALVRYQRMRGRNTLWQVGTDHAGIATQMVVERRLAQEGQSRHDLGRERFVEEIWRWKTESGGTITNQLRRMGASVDWSRERFTMDEGLSRAVREVFVQLYREGLIYRGKRLVNWDPVLHTAVSDLEVVSEEETGHIWEMHYPLRGRDEHVTVATTRPETMLGDTAVAVHPEDTRYAHLIGQTVVLPLVGREIPVIADEYVDPEFGTGCLKITPAHDFNDYAVGLRHDLPMINIFNESAEVNAYGGPYEGLDRHAARKRIVADLDAAGLLGAAREHRFMVPRGDRTGVVIEPYLTDQWFVRTGPLAEPAMEAVADGRIRFVPDNWKNTYFEWLRNIQDWCISRQIWWGHRIPAWYDEAGNVYVGHSEAEVRAEYGLGADVPIRRDEDVLDTWFSSALWPFSTLGWPEDTEELQNFYPTSVLVTGFDIIFFWVARMIMMGLKFTGDVPFREVYIHGLVRDSEGQKMSKSKGNVLDPIDLIDGIDLESLIAKRTAGLMQPEQAKSIEKITRKAYPDGIPAHGTDALRFTFAALASTGRDIKFDMGRIEGYRNFCNKLWNATRYVMLSCEGHDTGADGGEITLSTADRWIISRLQQTEQAVNDALAQYRFDLAAQALYEFTWDEYCDWYLELSKPILQDETASEASRRGTRRTLVRVLESLLRLIHPVMPFISEALWRRVAPLAGVTGDTIMTQPYPVADPERIDPDATEEMAWVMAVILGVRRIRGEMNINPGRPVPVSIHLGNDRERAWLENQRGTLNQLARLESLEVLQADTPPAAAAAALAGESTLYIPLAGLIDRDQELARLDKEIERYEKELDKARGKLANENFTSRAPAEVVAQERERVTEAEGALTKLRDQRNRVAALEAG